MKIKVARAKKSLTQKELCKKIGIGMNSLCKLEKGDFSTLRYPIMLKMAEVLEESVEDLFFKD